jgi:GT2 family glycosyltransferase
MSRAAFLQDYAITTTSTDCPVLALREHASQNTSSDIILIHEQTLIPPHTLERLVHYANHSQADVISPLGSGNPMLSPLKEGGRWRDIDVAAIDRGAALHGVRQFLPAQHWLPELSLWRQSALVWLTSNAYVFQPELPDALRGEVCSYVFVSRQDQVLLGPLASKDARYPRPSNAIDLIRPHFEPLSDTAPTYAGIDHRSVVLHILHGWGGGAHTFVTDLARADKHNVHLMLVARGNATRKQHGERFELLHAASSGQPLRSWSLSDSISATTNKSTSYRLILDAICQEYAVDTVMISSLIGHSLDALRTGLPTRVVMHDFYPLWPILHFAFDAQDACFDEQGLTDALHKNGANVFADRSAASWLELRNQYLTELVRAKASLIFPSAWMLPVVARISEQFAKLPSSIIAHGIRSFDCPIDEWTPPARTRPRALVLGRIHGYKGEVLLRQIIPQLCNTIDFYLLGCGKAGECFFGQSGVHIELDYDRDKLPLIVKRIAPDFALLASTVPETFSYTLSELWALSVPPAAMPIGSFQERITSGQNGWLLPSSITEAAAHLKSIAFDRDQQTHIRQNLRRLTLRTSEDMAADYVALIGRPNTSALRYTLTSIHNNLLTLSETQSALTRLNDLHTHTQKLVQEQQAELEQRANWVARTEHAFKERTQWAESLLQDIQQVQRQNETLQTELTDSKQNLNNLHLEFEECKQWALSLDKKQQQLAEELRATLSSRSWKLTRPLRAIGSRWRVFQTRGTFHTQQALSLLRRTLHSLQQRGLWATIQRINAWLKPRPISPTPLPVHSVSPEDFSPFSVPCNEKPTVSIIIPAYNHFVHTHRCLRSLVEHQNKATYEIIVVDDHSHDETESHLAQVSGLRVLRNASNQGFIVSCNAGAAIAQGDFLLFLNNDTVVTAGWLDALLNTFETQADCGLAGAQLIYPDGRLQEAGGIVFSDASGWNYGRFADPNDPSYNYLREVDYCSGAAILIRRDLFYQLGQFDLSYAPAYYEDTDLAFRVRSVGLKVYFQPQSHVVHFEGISSGTDLSSGTKRFQAINQIKFRERWQHELASQPKAGTPIDIAREHRKRGRILIIDACVPTPDQDSGSLRMLNIMRLLIDLGWKVLFIAENRAWDEKYTPPLQQLGVEMLYAPWVNDLPSWFEKNGHTLDVVLLSRHYVATPFLPLVREYARRARVIFDTVDLHFLREQREASLVSRPELAVQANATKERELKLVRECDSTWVVSPIEQQLLQTECPDARIEVLSNVHTIVGSRTPWSARKDIWFVGGFQHTPNVDAVLWFLNDIWPRVSIELNDVIFHIVGSRTPQAIFKLADNRVQVHGFVEQLDPFLDGCRVSIAPLRYGAGVKGKINQAMAHGQPVVATAIAVEGMYLQDENEVLVADDPDKFAQAIIRIYRDEALWNCLSQSALKNVSDHFSFQAARKILDKALA